MYPCQNLLFVVRCKSVTEDDDLKTIWKKLLFLCFLHAWSRVKIVVFIATFNTISVMSWQSVLLMELQGVKNNKTSVSRTYQYTCTVYIHVAYQYTCTVYIHVAYQYTCTVYIHVAYQYTCTVYIHVAYQYTCTVYIHVAYVTRKRKLKLHVPLYNRWLIRIL